MKRGLLGRDRRIWIRRTMKRIKWLDRVSKEEVIKKIKENRTLLKTIIKRRGDWMKRTVFEGTV